jgi:hypothetical protein
VRANCLAETDGCFVLLVKHHVRHGTVLLGLYVNRENGGLTLQTNFNAGELRYVRNIPGGRRQRAPPDGAAVVIFQPTPPHLRTYVDQCCERI